MTEHHGEHKLVHHSPYYTHLQLSEEETDFFKAQTGIENTEKLHSHLKDIQAAAFAVRPDPWISSYSFVRFKTELHPAYGGVLAYKNDPTAFFLDFGCEFGTDLRKLKTAGYPAKLLIGYAERAEFIDLGFELFEDAPYNAKDPSFLVGNIFNKNFYDPTLPSSQEPLPEIHHLPRESLTPFKQRVRFIHAAAFFEWFNQGHQNELAHILATLLIPTSGSKIFGMHVGSATPGPLESHPDAKEDEGLPVFCHSPDSLKKLWEDVFGADKIKVEIRVIEREDPEHATHVKHVLRGAHDHHTTIILVWTVTLL